MITRTASIDVTERIPPGTKAYCDVEAVDAEHTFYSRLNEDLVTECWNHIHLNCFSVSGEQLPWNQCARLFSIVDGAQFVGIYFDKQFHFTIGAKFHHILEGRTYWDLSITGVVFPKDFPKLNPRQPKCDPETHKPVR